MSEEMAVSDNTTGDEAKVTNDEATTAAVPEPETVAEEAPPEPIAPVAEEPPALAEEEPAVPDPEEVQPKEPKIEDEEPTDVKKEPESDDTDIPIDPPEDIDIKNEDEVFVKDEIETFEHNIEEHISRGIKRRASSTFSDDGDEEFKGFDDIKAEIKTEGYLSILERLEEEVTAASKDLVPLKTVLATLHPPGRASKRPRKDTDGSRPSSALSSRSDGDAATDASAASSPAQRGRRATTEMSSPLLRVPLERGWKRELVFRAALDAHSRRNADIYYYTPAGKKLRSTREVAEHLAGTGLTVENFSFFKEPLGVDDPEKEIIRDAKLIRRVESPVAAAPAPVEGKRTPKPKPPKGASPEPAAPAQPAKSPPAKLKSESGRALQPCSMSCGRGAVPSLSCAACLCLYHPACVGLRAAPPDPFFCKRAGSMSCGRGAVPSLSCAACLCLYHPACVGLRAAPPDPFFCKNCRKSSSPPLEPPPLTHKSGVTTASIPVPVPVPVPVLAPVPRRVPVPVPVPVPAKVPRDKRVLLRMKVAGGTPDGERVEARRTRVTNGAAVTAASPRRRARQRPDDTDHFTAFYNKAQENNYNVVVQIFQYLGMRELAQCARVCRLWRQLAATPALWRHVRMKNSHVSDWAGLCAALKRHGTKRLDLRKMLLPQNDTVFWEQFAQHIPVVDTLERIEMCRCPARAVEAVCRGLPGLRSLAALAIRDAVLDPAPLAALPLLHELRLKSMAGLSLSQDLRHLAALTQLTHLSLTSIKELGWCACDVIGSLPALESLELGECTFRAGFAAVLARLARLRRLRLERGSSAAAADVLRALARLPLLTRLELVNIDVKPGFDDALAECRNVQRLLIIPTYVSQSATTNRQVLSGVLRLRESLTHLMWGVTIELLRVTELFIDQCEQAGSPKRRDVGECIPVLKPVPGCRLPDAAAVAGPPQVEILPLPTLQRLLSQQLPTTKLKLLRIPFHATWRQSLADFQ
uniref:MBD domain-containing protein n=1 Tax=Heliothis virescens TaxID=7102 RepID=A0A2A4JDW6_HELVI